MVSFLTLKNHMNSNVERSHRNFLNFANGLEKLEKEEEPDDQLLNLPFPEFLISLKLSRD